MSNDIISEILDKSRWWQIRNILIIYLVKIIVAFFMACIIYTAPIPKRALIYCNLDTASPWIKIFHPPLIEPNDKEFDLPLCDAFADAKEISFRYFKNYTHSLPWIQPDFESAIPCSFINDQWTVFSVICSRGSLIVLTQGMHLTGILLSGPIAKYLMQFLSPKSVLQMAIILQVVGGNLSGLPVWLTVHLVCRCAAAIGCGGTVAAGSAIIADITNGKLMTGAIVLFDLFWSIGIIILSVVVQHESRFGELYFIISNPSILILLLTMFISDAPRWLLKREYFDKCESILANASKSWGSTAGTLPEDLSNQLKAISTYLRQLPVSESFFKTIQITKDLSKIFCFHLSYACFTILFFGMILNLRNYGPHTLPASALYLAFFEIIGCLAGFVLCLYLRQLKWQLTGTFNIIGALLALGSWIFYDKRFTFIEDGILLYFCLVLKASVSCSFAILTVGSKDIVPERHNQDLMAFTGTLTGRTVLLIAPAIVALGSPFGEFIPLTVFGVLGFIGGLAMISIGVTHRRERKAEILQIGVVQVDFFDPKSPSYSEIKMLEEINCYSV